jgi:hypothetical protein
MASATLSELLYAAGHMPRGSRSWLLDAAELSEAIGQSVMGDPAQLEAVRLAVRETADEAGCDLIVGASKVADQIVRDLNPYTVDPSRALVFDLVRITGSAIAQVASELRHVDVIPAVLVDMHQAPGASDVTPLSVVLPEVSRG